MIMCLVGWARKLGCAGPALERRRIHEQISGSEFAIPMRVPPDADESKEFPSFNAVKEKTAEPRVRAGRVCYAVVALWNGRR
jgi:hypothetical protein